MENVEAYPTSTTEEEYWQGMLHSVAEGPSSLTVTSRQESTAVVGNIGNFDQAFTRKKHSKKVLKLLGKRTGVAVERS